MHIPTQQPLLPFTSVLLRFHHSLRFIANGVDSLQVWRSVPASVRHPLLLIGFTHCFRFGFQPFQHLHTECEYQW